MPVQGKGAVVYLPLWVLLYSPKVRGAPSWYGSLIFGLSTEACMESTGKICYWSPGRRLGSKARCAFTASFGHRCSSHAVIDCAGGCAEEGSDESGVYFKRGACMQGLIGQQRRDTVLKSQARSVEYGQISFKLWPLLLKPHFQ